MLSKNWIVKEPLRLKMKIMVSINVFSNIINYIKFMRAKILIESFQAHFKKILAILDAISNCFWQSNALN